MRNLPHQIINRHPMTRHTRTPLAAALASLLIIGAPLLFSGCASTPEAEIVAPTVFPLPPDEPRFIFERALRYSTNVEQLSTRAKLKRYATGEDPEVKGLVKPFAVAAHQGRVYVTDSVQRRVIMFDLQGNRYKEFENEAPGELFKPAGIDLSPLGDVYVADVGARRIAVYDAEGKFLRFIGDPSRLQRPAGIALSPNGQRAYILDTGGVDSQDHRIEVYDAIQGEYLTTIGRRGTGEGEFNLPIQITVARDGTLYVVDKGNFRVQAFDADGKFLRSFGSIGRLPGQFFSPKGITTDSDGNIYVVDTAFGNVQLFNPAGQLLMVIGQRGQSSAPGNYMLPSGIDVDENGRVYIVDQFFRKVDIYRPVTHPAATSTQP